VLKERGGADPPLFVFEGLSFGAARRIGGRGRVQVEKPFVGGVIRCVAIAVRRILRGTMRGEFLAARRLRELPHCGVAAPALRRCWWILRESASGRRRTSIVVDPVDEVAAANVVADVVGTAWQESLRLPLRGPR
jgi:hypothetical protein